MSPVLPVDPLVVLGPARWLLTYALHSTVILGGVWLLTRRGPLSRPRHRTLLWRWAVLAGLVTASVRTALPAPEPAVSVHHGVWIEGSVRGEGGVASSGAMAEVDLTLARVAGPGRDGGIASAMGGPPSAARVLEADAHVAVDRVRRRLASVQPTGLKRWRSLWPWCVLGAWLAGAAGLGVASLRARLAFARRTRPRRQAPPAAAQILDDLARSVAVRQVRLVQVPGLGGPVALGGRTIAIPAHVPLLLEPAELRAALAHELGHLARRDPAWLGVFRWVETLLFFQPLNRLARRDFVEASEFMADAWALERTHDPLALARSLEKVARWIIPEPGPAPAVARAESPLVERVRRIVAGGEREEGRVIGQAVSAILLLPALLLPAAPVPAPSVVRVVVVRQVQDGAGGLHAEADQAVFVLQGVEAPGPVSAGEGVLRVP